jgi:hypothetical protein
MDGWGCDAGGDRKDGGESRTVLGFTGARLRHLTLGMYGDDDDDDDDPFGCLMFRSNQLVLEHTRRYVAEMI